MEAFQLAAQQLDRLVTQRDTLLTERTILLAKIEKLDLDIAAVRATMSGARGSLKSLLDRD